MSAARLSRWDCSRTAAPIARSQVCPCCGHPRELKRIYAAGHTDFQTPDEASNVAWIDPETLEFERIFHHPYMEGFAAATTAMPIGGDIWLGTNRGEMIAYFPAP